MLISPTDELLEELDEVLETTLDLYERICENLCSALSYQRQAGLTDADIVAKTGLMPEFVTAALAFWDSWPLADPE